MTKVDLTLPLARTEPTVQQPGGINEKVFLSKTSCILLSRRLQVVVSIVLESEGVAEERAEQI